MTALSILLLKLFLTAAASWGQAVSSPPAPERATTVASPAESITIPAGTRIELTVMNQVYDDATHISLQVAVPVVQGERIVIPAKTEVLGLVETTRWRGRDGERERARLRLDHMLFPNHTLVIISGLVEGLPRFPHSHAGISGATVAGMGILGGLILTALTNNAAPFIIGAAAGGAGGIATAAANRSGPVWLRTGNNFEMVLELPLTLDPNHIE